MPGFTLSHIVVQLTKYQNKNNLRTNTSDCIESARNMPESSMKAELLSYSNTGLLRFLLGMPWYALIVLYNIVKMKIPKKHCLTKIKKIIFENFNFPTFSDLFRPFPTFSDRSETVGYGRPRVLGGGLLLNDQNQL